MPSTCVQDEFITVSGTALSFRVSHLELRNKSPWQLVVRRHNGLIAYDYYTRLELETAAQAMVAGQKPVCMRDSIIDRGDLKALGAALTQHLASLLDDVTADLEAFVKTHA